MTLAAGLALTLLALLSLAGWGRLCGRIAGYDAPGVSMSAAIGLAAVIFAGGVLNLLHVSFGWVLDLVLAGGALLLVVPGGRSMLSRGGAEVSIYSVAAWGGAFGITAFAAVFQLAPTAFNFHDDFEKYFAFPVRMLQTGTLAGNPLSALGSETLGAEALLHGMVLHHFPIGYINGVDAVFGLLLCLLLPACILPSRPAYVPAALCSMAVVVAINPQIINISAAYLVCALVMAVMVLFCSGTSNDEPPALLAGLLLAALIALKTIFVLYAAFFLLLGAATVLLAHGDIRRRSAWLARAAGSTLLFLAPWGALYLPRYLHIGGAVIIPPALSGTEEVYGERFGLFSAERMYYGSRCLDYTLVALLTLIFSLVALAYYRRQNGRVPIRVAGAAAAGMAVVVSYLAIIALGPLLNGYFHSLRYTIPLLAAGMPVIGCMVLTAAASGPARWQAAGIVGVLAAQAAVAGLFAPDALERFRQGRDTGHVLAFSGLATSPEYLAYNRDVLQGGRMAYIRKIQEVIPPGQPFFAWITTPFHFNYRRNTVYDAEHAGIGTPWAALPTVEYYVVEYEGYAVVPRSTLYEDLHYPGARERYVSRKCLSLQDTLDGVRTASTELYNDGRITVFRTSGTVR